MGKPETNHRELSAAGLKIAIVSSRYNPQICDGLASGALNELERLGLPKEKVILYEVPGAFELPVMAKWLAEKGEWDALVCLGAVVRGDTAHFDYVCQGVTLGLQQAMLQTGIPMAFGVLTTDTEHQALERAGNNGHNKGSEAARTAVEMAQKRKALL